MKRRSFLRNAFLAVAGAVAITKFGELPLPMPEPEVVGIRGLAYHLANNGSYLGSARSTYPSLNAEMVQNHVVRLSQI